jgi:ribosomal protein S18 acetylase RimI-like enzyme
MNLTLRPFTPADQDFVFKLYAGTRVHELTALGWNSAQQEAFLRMQFAAQQRWYEMAYAAADHQIICADDEAIGRIMVLDQPNRILLVDIALLPEQRNHGIGARLIGQLIARSDESGIPVGLQVLKTNPAIHLYQRLGFVQTGEDDMYFQMERKPASNSN